jgi:hypothetical protein
MDQTADQITHDIRSKRDDLRSNLEELEGKVKSVTDWRRHFEKHTGAMIAVAFASGALVSILSSGRNSRGVGRSLGAASTSENLPRGSDVGTRNELLAKWDSVKSALVGVAATRITGYLNQIVPGFHEELQKTETRRLQGPDPRLGASAGRSN